MNAQMEVLLNGARDGYLDTFDEEVSDVDRIVELLKDPGFTWTSADLIRRWPEITERFLQEHATGEGTDIAKELLTEGSVDGTRVDVGHIYYKDGAWAYDKPAHARGLGDAVWAYKRRLFFAYLAMQAPSDFETINSNDVFALHGTKGYALPEIIAQRSLISHRQQDQPGIPSGSAEEHPVAMRRNFISFASVDDELASTYATTDRRRPKHLDSLREGAHLYDGWQLRLDEIEAYNARLEKQIASGNTYLEMADATRFGVMLGLSKSALWMAGLDPKIGHRVNVNQSTPEYGFGTQVSIDYLPVMAVPDDYRADVEKLLSESTYQPAIISSDTLAQARDAASHAQR